MMETLKGFRILTLPTDYSEADLRTRGLLLEAIRKIEADCKAAAKPYLDALAEIDAAYPVRTVLVPSNEA